MSINHSVLVLFTFRVFSHPSTFPTGTKNSPYPPKYSISAHASFRTFSFKAYIPSRSRFDDGLVRFDDWSNSCPTVDLLYHHIF